MDDDESKAGGVPPEQSRDEHGTKLRDRPEPARRRRRYVARWSVVLPLMALTWALMFYLIYRAIQSGRL